jgi:hypothetical protein
MATRGKTDCTELVGRRRADQSGARQVSAETKRIEQIDQVPRGSKCGISEAASASLKRAYNESRCSFGKVAISFGTAHRTSALMVRVEHIERRRLGASPTN